MKVIDGRKVVQNKLAKYALISDERPVLIGDEAGVVNVLNRPGYIYVRDTTGNTLIVWNSRAPNIANLAAMIGTENGRLQVTRVRDVYSVLYPNVGSHHFLHEYGNLGTDVVLVYPEQFMAWYLYTSPDDNFTCKLLRQAMDADVAWESFGTEDVDLNSHIPTYDTDALYVLISVNAAGDVVCTDGEPVSEKALLITANIPLVPLGNSPLWAVRLYVGQTTITRSHTDSDYVDLRWSLKRTLNTRTYTFVIGNLATGGIPGPRLNEFHTVERIDSYVTGATSVTFNIEERATIGSAGVDILSSDQVADVDGASKTTPFANDSLAEASWLWVDISNVSGTPGILVITLTCRI
jgi:hypothetical protein